MPHAVVDVDSDVAAERAMAAATDFSERRPESWPSISLSSAVLSKDVRAHSQRGGRAVGHPQLAIRVLEMLAHGVLGNHECLGNLTVRRTCGDHGEHLALRPRQHIRGMRSGA